MSEKYISEKTEIYEEQIEDQQRRRSSVAEQATELSGIEATAASKSAWLISLTISQCGLLFGYDTGYISSVLVTIGTSLGHELTHNEEELVTSLTSGGALVGAVFAGLSADRWGRKMPIWFACGIFLLGTLLQTVAFSVPQFAVGRFVVGLGVGSASMIAPLFIGEIAPARYRGRMIAFNNLSVCKGLPPFTPITAEIQDTDKEIALKVSTSVQHTIIEYWVILPSPFLAHYSVTFGQFFASALGAGFQHINGPGWRATVAIGALPAMTLAGLLILVPESPRQLVAHGKVEEADRSLQKIYQESTPEQRQAKIKSIELSLAEATQNMAGQTLGQTFKLIFTTPATARAVATACIIMAVSQLGGFNTLMYYAGTLFSIVGFKNATAVAMTVSGTNFLFSFVNLVLVDRFGRRIILCVTVLGMSICMATAAIAFHWMPIDRHTLELTAAPPSWAPIIVLMTIICYVGFFSAGVATIAWIGVELIPLEVRAIGGMMNTVTCWSTNIIIASTFLSMMKGLTPSGAFGFYAGICFCGWLFVIFFYPEVKGMPLEAIREVFATGFGVKFSKQWQRENKYAPKVVTEVFGH